MSMMNKYVPWLVLSAVGIASSAGAEESYGLAEAEFIRQGVLSGADEGKLQSIDLGRRSVVVNGYEYQAGTDMSAVEVKMLGSSAGSLALLVAGMYVHVEYRQLKRGRIGTAIWQMEVDQRMDH